MSARDMLAAVHIDIRFKCTETLMIVISSDRIAPRQSALFSVKLAANSGTSHKVYRTTEVGGKDSIHCKQRKLWSESESGRRYSAELFQRAKSF